MLPSGRQFDSTRIYKDKERPYTFQVGMGKVIVGWDEAFLKVSLCALILKHIR